MDLEARDMKSLAAVSLVAVISVVLVQGFVDDASVNNLDYQTQSDWGTGIFTDTEVVSDNLQLAGGNTTGTWNTGLLANEVLTESEVNATLGTNNSATLTVNYYNSSADDPTSGTVQATDTFTVNDGTNDFTLNHNDQYEQVAFEFELNRDTSTDASPVVETFTAYGEKSGLSWTIFGFLAALLAVAGIMKIMDFI